MDEYFPGDSYESGPDIPRAIREYILLGSRWSPYSMFINVILRYRGHALRGTYDDAMWSKSSFEVITGLEKSGARFRISGLDRVRALTGPVVFISNHMSTLETVTLPGLICPIKPVTYVVKEKLTKGLVWGPIMRSRDPIVVARKDPKADLEAVLSGGADRLSRGISIIIFPQGTRKDIFNRQEFNSLGVKLAARTGVPVVPIAVRTDFWGNGRILRGFGPVHRSHPIHIEFGEPIAVEGRGKIAHEKILEFIESRLKLWGAKVQESEKKSADKPE